MTPDEQVTMPLVEAMIGRSHAELRGELTGAVEQLGGRLDVLAEAQRGAAREAQLGRELSSREHRAVEDRLSRVDRKLDTALERLSEVEQDDRNEEAARQAVAKLGRRFVVAAGLIMPTWTAAAIFVAGRIWQ